MSINAISRFRPETISYKGHGQIESATASSSVGHVLLHELRHKLDFEEKARREGQHVVQEDINIDFEFRDGFLVAVSGKTTATTAPTNERRQEDRETGKQGVSQDAESPSPTESVSYTPQGAADDYESRNPVAQRLDTTEQRANSALQAIENSLKQGGSGDPGILESKRVKLRQIKAEIERLKRHMQIEQVQKGAGQILHAAAQADRIAIRMAVASAESSAGDGQNRNNGVLSHGRRTDRPTLSHPTRRLRTDIETAVNRITTALSTVAPLGGVIDIQG